MFLGSGQHCVTDGRAVLLSGSVPTDSCGCCSTEVTNLWKSTFPRHPFLREHPNLMPPVLGLTDLLTKLEILINFGSPHLFFPKVHLLPIHSSVCGAQRCIDTCSFPGLALQGRRKEKLTDPHFEGQKEGVEPPRMLRATFLLHVSSFFRLFLSLLLSFKLFYLLSTRRRRSSSSFHWLLLHRGCRKGG